MRALVISDAHFGAWTEEPLLQHDWARPRLGDALEDVDALVLLGDLLDFLFSLGATEAELELRQIPGPRQLR